MNNAHISDFLRLESEYLSGVDKPLIGYLCLRVPVELIEAYGAVPVRIVSPAGVQPEGHPSIRADACSFCRSIPSVMAVEPYDRLAAIIAGGCCDQMRRLTETLGNELDIPVIFFGAPRTWNSDRTYFIAEMKEAFAHLGRAIGSERDDEALRHYIEIRNELRELVNRLRDDGRLPGKLLHKIAASALPADMTIGFLSGLNPDPLSEDSIRLMLMGSIPSGKELALIDEMGGQVVADATCLGDRAFVLPKSPLNDDPIHYLYQHYIEDNLCPHRRPMTPLIEYIKELIQLRRVEGVVFRAVKYCHPYGLAATRFRKELDKPFLQLDDDLTLLALGSFRTRIGAFVEMLEAKKRMRAKG